MMMQIDDSPAQNRVTPAWIPFLAGSVLIWVSVVASSTLVHASLEHWKIGLFMGLMFGTLLTFVVAIPLSSLGFLIVRAYANKTDLTAMRRFALLSLPSLVASSAVLIFGLSTFEKRARFKSHVMKPIPSSVGILDVEGFSGFLAHRWLLIFDISPRDFENLIKACRLEKVPPYDYLEALKSYTTSKVEPLATPDFYGWSTSNQVPSRWRGVVANSNHTRVYFMAGFQN
jgi:hypothetical protein